ncbi:formyltetrahydrofolate-dependent phosphoribosylglycinamide formyltransferase [Hoeflea marina]|uniref:Phosphoribosylglycinamide formyltransferase n=1 Tax=Hoeflea marina TaxID=274592 RepID=A0A317PVA2_9HYPH|nr:phosphoribosylglycinamide formyltransferase [Hoeflea marina]PWW03350.1 formyltetrahydrofolate-dependent phosphoribosylglycinamide formyltransferase [Hoeflea marina]
MSAAATAAGRTRVAVLISGRGSNMAALMEAARSTDYPARIALVISDKPEAKGLQTAGSYNIATRAIARTAFADKASHEAAISEAIEASGAELVCLAGYMRLLSGSFIHRWRGRIINIHPSLLPSFPGLDTHHRALAAGCRIHGCTVHFVTEGMDEGPIIAQAAVPVLTGDTPESLSARVLEAEHRLYPEALAMVARGAVRMGADGQAIFRD